MSLFDPILARARQYVLLCDAVGRLGPGWIAFRLRYTFEHRLGLLVRRSPIRDWPTLVSANHIPEIVDTAALGEWLAEHGDDERLNRLHRHATDIAARRFDVFGKRVSVDGWHHDGRDDHRYDPDVHWSRVSTPVGADIKFVWEPSRFGWVFDLVRLQLIGPLSGADATFWEVFDEWCVQNPPNRGVNWVCGQEASIRLMAVVVAGSGMRDTATVEQMQKLQRFAWVTAERVEMNIAYARSQRNNHHASEAVGLLTAALLFPEHLSTRRWRELGEKHLREVCEKLVFEDGGTSQYSTNYHRVFLHNFVWAAACYRTSGIEVPGWLSKALSKTGELLGALADPTSGFAPFFGHDDGAMLLPLSHLPHRNLSGDVLLARAAAGARAPVRQGQGLEREALQWFGSGARPVAEAEPAATEVAGWSMFESFGVHVLSAGGSRAIVRAGSFRYRPSQDDLLHCDVWIDGVNVAIDSGTFSYHGESIEEMMDSSSHHNGPRRDGFPLMSRVSRFLWARWATAGAESISVDGDEVVGVFWAEQDSQVIWRTVVVTPEQVRVSDECVEDGRLSVHWRIPTGIQTPDIADASSTRSDDCIAGGYGRLEKCQLIEARSIGSSLSAVFNLVK